MEILKGINILEFTNKPEMRTLAKHIWHSINGEKAFVAHDVDVPNIPKAKAPIFTDVENAIIPNLLQQGTLFHKIKFHYFQRANCFLKGGII